VILFIDEYAAKKLDATMTSFLEGCGCTLVKLPLRMGDERRCFYMRHLIFGEFFRTRMSVFDRIISVDVYDTIFQGDPFFRGFDQSAIGIVAEPIVLCGAQLNSIVAVAGERYRENFSKLQNVNAGFSMGTIELYLRFLELYRDTLGSLNQSVVKSLRYADQDVLNAIIWSNATTRAGIPMRLYHGEDYYHCAYLIGTRDGVIREIGRYKIPTARMYPLVIHQADRAAPLMNSVITACPQQFPQVDAYLRTWK
jgi:hypothetical protein